MIPSVFFAAFFSLLSITIFSSTVYAFSDTETPSILYFKEQGILGSDGEAENFYPRHLISREDFIVWSLRNLGVLDPEMGQEPFLDVGKDDEAAPYIAKAWELGGINTNKYFFPKNKITVAEALKVLMTLEGVPLPRVYKTENTWDDLPENPILKSAVLKSLDLGIWRSISKNTTGAQRKLTREEAVEMLTRILTFRENSGAKNIQISFSPVNKKREKSEVFDYVWDAIHDRFLYQDRVHDDKLMEAAITGMVKELGDEYSIYFAPPDAKEFQADLNGEFEGIGAQLGENEAKDIVFARTYPGTPAEKAGILSGDVILKVGDLSMKGKKVDEVVNYIRGPAGTEVKITILRNGSEMILSLTRAAVEIPLVLPRLEGDILVLEILSFADKTAQDFRSALEKYTAEGNISGIIVDLRGNGGGLLDGALEMLGSLLPENSVGIWEKSLENMEKLEVKGDGKFQDIPLVVFVDKYSASASEIFAAAIQDSKRGRVVGSKSFGKGTVQELAEFSDGALFKMTRSEWLSPLQRSIQGLGVTPDVAVNPSDTAAMIVTAKQEIQKLKK